MQTVEVQDTQWESYTPFSSPLKKPYEYSQQTVPDLGKVSPDEHRQRSSEDRRDTLRYPRKDNTRPVHGDKTSVLQEFYRSQTGAADLEVVETLLSFSKLEAARWNSQKCHTSALELPPSPPSSQGGVSPHHPLESDVEEACDTMHLRRRTPTKDPEFVNVCT